MNAVPERIPWGETRAEQADDDSPGTPNREARLRVAEVLRGAGVVLLPTETVYGFAARADDPAAVERLRALKGRPSEQALTWHVGSRAALERFPSVSPMVRRLTERYWPGPLTMVLPGVPEGLELCAQDGWTGVRFPAHAATAALLERLDFPVVATSANRHGEPPIGSAAEAAASFEEQVDLVLDGGTPRLGESSVVLRIGRGRFELLREGIVELEQLRRVAGRRIAFVCTGNTCRSPMAEGLARATLARRLEVSPDAIGDFGMEVHSMGVAGGFGGFASPHAVEVLAERDIDISEHRSRAVVPEEIEAFDHVYALTQSHLEILQSVLPPGRGKHIELLDPAGRSVPDPIGGSRADYAKCADHIGELIEKRAQDWV